MWEAKARILPDLSSPATLGCLLALVREAWGDLYMHVETDRAHWYVAPGETVDGLFSTEAEALVLALERAP